VRHAYDFEEFASKKNVVAARLRYRNVYCVLHMGHFDIEGSVDVVVCLNMSCHTGGVSDGVLAEDTLEVYIWVLE
jgi:NADH:ubiquinone oxidoreductase subunit E